MWNCPCITYCIYLSTTYTVCILTFVPMSYLVTMGVDIYLICKDSNLHISLLLQWPVRMFHMMEQRLYKNKMLRPCNYTNSYDIHNDNKHTFIIRCFDKQWYKSNPRERGDEAEYMIHQLYQSDDASLPFDMIILSLWCCYSCYFPVLFYPSALGWQQFTYESSGFNLR